MNKYQLKQLIREVIREVDGMSAGTVEAPPSEKEPGLTTSPGAGLPHSLKHRKEYGDVVIKLSLGGINKNNRHIIHDFINQAAYVAAQQDLDVIHAELEKQGKIGMSVDEPEIELQRPKMSGEDIDALLAKMEKEPVAGGMPSKAAWKKMSPEERDKYIKAGSHEAEWKAAIQKDMETARERAKEREKQRVAGTLKTFVVNPNETDPTKRISLPMDTSMWTDKEWDIYNAGEEVRMATTSKGKAAYRPRFSQKQISPEFQKKAKGAVAPGLTQTLR